VLILVIGTLGFMLLGDFGFVDALYMTVITITTVGFGEVSPLDQTTKIFTICLILTSVFTLGYVISVVSEYILNKNTLANLKQKTMQKQIAKLSNHVIICGYGRNGTQAAAKLKASKKAFVVIEKDSEVIEVNEDKNIVFVLGDATTDEVLLEAGVKKAAVVIAATPDDSANAFIILSAKQLHAQLNLISRASTVQAAKKIKLAGADHVILPDIIGGNHMASLVVAPDLIEFLEHLGIRGESIANIEEVASETFMQDSLKKTIRDLDIRKNTGCTIIGFKSAVGDYIINPEPETFLEPKSKLIVLGRADQIMSLKELCHQYEN
jgi:voltage-gated potassium channel